MKEEVAFEGKTMSHLVSIPRWDANIEANDHTDDSSRVPALLKKIIENEGKIRDNTEMASRLTGRCSVPAPLPCCVQIRVRTAQGSKAESCFRGSSRGVIVHGPAVFTQTHNRFALLLSIRHSTVSLTQRIHILVYTHILFI